MNKVKKGKSRTAAKSKNAPMNFEAYILGVPEGSRPALNQMRAAIRSVVPRNSTEVISYGMPAFRHDGILVWFAAFAKHCSLFPKASVIAAFLKELKGFKTSKGTIQFPIDQPLPIQLIKRIVKARVAEAASPQPK